jgi:RNA polymerase sigma factor (sigma-70 family)
MSTTDPPPQPLVIRQATFHTTQWSVVLAAQGKAGDAVQSLEALCSQYWPPLYAYVRQRGHTEHDAQDLTQSFFARFLEKEWLAAVDRERGRFRTFLLMAFKRFLANEWDREKAQKRGGVAKVISMDAAEQMSLPDPKSMTAESLYERQWAMTLLESVMRHLRQEHESVGRLTEYEQLKTCLTAERGGIDYKSIAADLNIQPASARSKVHRLRKRFREVFREKVSGTVADPADVDDEMRALIAALGSA